MKTKSSWEILCRPDAFPCRVYQGLTLKVCIFLSPPQTITRLIQRTPRRSSRPCNKPKKRAFKRRLIKGTRIPLETKIAKPRYTFISKADSADSEGPLATSKKDNKKKVPKKYNYVNLQTYISRFSAVKAGWIYKRGASQDQDPDHQGQEGQERSHSVSVDVSVRI